MFSLFRLPDFIKIRHISVLRPNLSKWNFGSRSAISNIIFMINKLDWFSVHWDIFHFCDQIFVRWGDWYFFNVNVCYLARILFFLVVTWWLLLVTLWLLVVTTRHRSLLLVPTFSMNAFWHNFRLTGKSFGSEQVNSEQVEICYFNRQFLIPSWSSPAESILY